MPINKTKVKLRAFNICQKFDSQEHLTEIVDAFHAKYDKTDVEERMRIINEEDREYEVIPFLVKDQNTIFGAILRLEIDSQSPLISSELLKKKNFRLSELAFESNKNNIYKGHYYFCFNNKKISNKFTRKYKYFRTSDIYKLVSFFSNNTL